MREPTSWLLLVALLTHRCLNSLFAFLPLTSHSLVTTLILCGTAWTSCPIQCLFLPQLQAEPQPQEEAQLQEEPQAPSERSLLQWAAQ